MNRSNRIGLGVALLLVGMGMIVYAQVREDVLAAGHWERYKKAVAEWEYDVRVPRDVRLPPGPPLDYYNLLLMVGGICSVAAVGLIVAALASKSETRNDSE